MKKSLFLFFAFVMAMCAISVKAQEITVEQADGSVAFYQPQFGISILLFSPKIFSPKATKEDYSSYICN